MEFWIVEDGEKRGPLQSYEVRERIQRGDLDGSELAWHGELDEWRALKEMDVFRSEFEEPEPEPQEVEAPPLPEPAPQPFLRFWARWFDVFLYMAVIFGVLWVTGQDITEAILTPVFRGLWFLPYLILEALSMHYYKTTPGKFLLGLRVVTADEQALSLGAALLRSLRVFILGMGVFYWPWLLPIVCHALCCWYTFKHGQAPWDILAGTKVRSAGIFLFPVLLFVLAFMVILIFLAVLVLPGLFQYQELANSGAPAS